MALIDTLKAATQTAKSNISSEASAAKNEVLSNINDTLMNAASSGTRAVMIHVEEAFPVVNLYDAQDVTSKLNMLVEILGSEGINSSRIGNQASASW